MKRREEAEKPADLPTSVLSASVPHNVAIKSGSCPVSPDAIKIYETTVDNMSIRNREPATQK
jgi:hypothetical protein